MKHLWLVTADEIDGEHERLIKFLVKAETLDQANQLALKELRSEWGDDDDVDAGSTDERITFFGEEIAIDSITIRKVSVDEAIQFFMRGGE